MPWHLGRHPSGRLGLRPQEVQRQAQVVRQVHVAVADGVGDDCLRLRVGAPSHCLGCALA